MKLQLLLGTLMFSAFTVKAQVSSINENFDNFTSGNSTFPQSGWSAVVAPMVTGTAPFPVPPRMIVTTGSDKAVQSYSGTNATDSSYLISPQIQSPSGTKTLSFKTTLVSPSPGPGNIQIGVASNPSDMSTFVPVGTPINVTTIGTIQNESIPIPAVTGSYLVFKFTPSSQHVAIQIDDVVYDTSSSLSVRDNHPSAGEIRFAVNADQTALEFIFKTAPKNIRIYSAVGEKVSEGKLIGRQFGISSLPSGVYFLNFETEEGKTISSKFVKK
ncbi:T9SS type A sorting domain-containing protein [Chryseobacterium gallinarum]|uniref:T9SS-dependent choice-of-anchor J family protein n=1 Tax=Chryseobacterium gallinarum TaxID=1324352 RepID=UPI00202472D1|nr:choice-of-anchor J domain-containing protein [Chryseobacterium gallinarum]MCL8537437.1 T9SS type A sorting domain-containing protein [Chryseobacterium gallinarum]